VSQSILQKSRTAFSTEIRRMAVSFTESVPQPFAFDKPRRAPRRRRGLSEGRGWSSSHRGSKIAEFSVIETRFFRSLVGLLRGYLNALRRAQGTKLGYSGSLVDFPNAQGQSAYNR
jgi:hypothetical protein